MDDQDDSLSILPSYRFYKNLDKMLGIVQNDDDYWEEIEDKLKKIDGMSTSSEKFKRAFCHVYYMKSMMSSYEHRWNYLFYWTGFNAFKNVKKSDLFREVMNILKSIKMKFDDSDINDYDISNIDEEKFNSLKIIYDYFQNFEDIKRAISQPTYLCSAKYKSYIEDGFNEYEKIERTCTPSSESHCSIFKDIKQRFSNVILTKLECPRVSDAESVGTRQSAITQGQQELASELQGRQDTHMGILDESVGPGAGTSSNDDTIVSIIVPFLGILLSSFILYKFTPFGPWLRTHVLWKKIIRSGTDEDETQELLTHTYNSENIDSQGFFHQIGYNPGQNFSNRGNMQH
ncbi:PIR Superfamily Protein [Plasmodium ovale curtisi]|uniref:PIR Superfamily Protein n=2 Tax=Plasmodium ovale TaxID=36330 RepID=A0A1A8W4J7_PLAOA|nr:PIR Superfamily Protein [Plasmodium ovale curtisi]